MLKKSVRDSVLANAGPLLVYEALTSQGFDGPTSLLSAAIVGFMLPLGYRIVRRNWPWLLSVDAPGSK